MWNIGTASCGAAQNFTQLFTVRFLVGAGESVIGPTAYAILGDLSPRDEMTWAIVLLHLGDVMGPATALPFGALELHVFLGIKPIHVPFGVIHGWPIEFILIGLPSLIISVLILVTVPEPKRRAIRNQMAQLKGHAAMTGSGLAAGFRDYGVAIRYINLKRGILWPLFGAVLAGSLSIGGVHWAPTFYQRTYGWGRPSSRACKASRSWSSCASAGS